MSQEDAEGGLRDGQRLLRLDEELRVRIVRHGPAACQEQDCQ